MLHLKQMHFALTNVLIMTARDVTRSITRRVTAARCLDSGRLNGPRPVSKKFFEQRGHTVVKQCQTHFQTSHQMDVAGAELPLAQGFGSIFSGTLNCLQDQDFMDP